MPPEELVLAFLDEMRDSDEIAIADTVAGENRVALLVMEGVAAVLIGWPLGVHDTDRDYSLEWPCWKARRWRRFPS